MLNENFIKKFANERNIGGGTLKGYLSVLGDYSEYFNLDLEFLINEALDEEDERVPLRRRKLKQRLIDYRTFLISKKLSSSSIKTYFSRIKTFYRHFGVEIPMLPSVKLDRGYESGFGDLPTRQDLLSAIRISSVSMKAVILFMSSSGTAKAETLSLKIRDFIEATGDYHSGGEISEVLEELSRRSDVVPTFYLKRLKTGKFYYTFCSPEASSAIVEYLFSRGSLNSDDRLFDFTDMALTNNFQRINDDLGFGWVGNYRFFRSHALRKYHASNIGLDVCDIDALQGRNKSPVHEAYIKTNPELLKKKYVGAMENVAVNRKEKEDIDLKIVVNVIVDGVGYKLI